MRFPKLLALGAMLWLSAAAAWAQHLSAGVIGGVPLTDFVSTAASVDPSHPFAFFANTKRYIVGVSGEVRLPFGLGIEIDALYRHLNYTGSGSTTGVTAVNTASSTTGNAWEFPLVAKYHFPSKVIRPYVEGGVAWDSLQGLTQTIRNTVLATGLITSSSTSNPAELSKSTVSGFVIGAGVDVHALVIHITPEIRYTRWGAKHFLDPNGLLNSNQNQAEFLVGFTF